MSTDERLIAADTTSADERLVARHVEPNPNRPGAANWWLKDSGVSVWAIIGYWKTPGQDADSVAAAYLVDPEAVAAALAYYERNRVIIDNRLADNEA